MMSDQLDNRKVSLEDLLRLKREERPEPAFWDRFEQELRSKQLAAIVERRPWWHFDFERITSQVGKLKFPLGATAVLALTLVGVREYRHAGQTVAKPAAIDVATSSSLSGSAPAIVSESAVSDAASVSQSDAIASNVAVPTAVVSAPSSSPAPAYVAVSRETAAEADNGSLSRLIPWIGEALDASTTALVSGVTRSLQPSLVSLRDASIELSPAGQGRSALPLASLASRSAAPDEPLAKLTGPTDPQRARLATYVAAAFRPEGVRTQSSDRVRERAISRMSDDELYSSVSRIGVAGAAGGGLRLNF